MKPVTLFLIAIPTHSKLCLTKSLFHQLLSLSVNDTIFTFEDNFYKQIDCMPMGSPQGLTFADIFLSHFETIWLNQCPPDFKPITYKHYIDDCFLIFKHKFHSDLFF